jgi:NAD(P)-dependent dehydrogenase (short-subunit alcohol dehydrogenase family)
MPWTTDNIASQQGKIIVVTGGNSGIGFEAAKVLAQKGAELVLACRDARRGEEACREIRETHPAAAVSTMPLDLADLASVRAFAAAFAERFPRLDVLIDNAGVMVPPRGETADGFETQMGVNHLGHFALTGLLLPALRNAPAPRVVVTTSVMHRAGCLCSLDFKRRTRRHRPWRSYSDSKLANLSFALELHRRLGGAEQGVAAIAVHPGVTATGLQRHLCLSRPLTSLIAMNVRQGALPTLYAATSPELSGGEFIGPDGCMGVRGYPAPARPSRRAGDPALARRLWEASEEATGVRYGAN